MKMKLLTFAIGASVAISALLVSSQPASAAVIAVWDDPAFVDTTGGLGAESDTIQASLVSLGHTVVTFTGTTAAAWTAGLAGAAAVVIPETEVSSLTGASLVAGGGGATLAAYVSAGGGLITAFDTGSLIVSDSVLGNVFGISPLGAFGASGAEVLNVANAAGTAFAGGPAGPLPAFSATIAFLVTDVIAAGGTPIYDDGTGSVVSLFSSGSGQIAALGWDWFNAAPLGANDAGWIPVLGNAVSQVTAQRVPEPATLAILGLGLASLGFARRRRMI